MKNNNKKTKGLLIWGAFTAIMIIVVCAAVLFFVFKVDFSGSKNNEPVKTNEVVKPSPSATTKPKKESPDVEVVPTMEEKISTDAVWVPTFQLVWNDMMDELVKDDVKFEHDTEPDYLENLNAQLFKEDNISDEYIYKKFGKTSNELKDEILEGIKEKFDETSDIIDPNEDWTTPDDPDSANYTFYVMLKRIFNFENPFDKFDKEEGTFADGKYSNIEYFGINEDSSEDLYDQVTILYYDTKDEFAFMVDTKEGDKLIFSKGVEGDTFAEIYENIANKAENFEERTDFGEGDTLKIPNLNLDLQKDYKEVCNKPFRIYNIPDAEKYAMISKALQTVKLELDNEGGKIKSEAIIQTENYSASIDDFDVRKPYYLELNDEFVMFVQERGKETPYFALKVSDISKYQEDIETND